MHAGLGVRYIAWLPPTAPALVDQDAAWVDIILAQARAGEERGAPNPNDAIVDSLSESGREAYMAQLWGQHGGLGCAENAFAVVDEKLEQFHGGSQLEALETGLDSLPERIWNAPAMVAAVENTAECMDREVGVQARNENGFYSWIEGLLDEAVIADEALIGDDGPTLELIVLVEELGAEELGFEARLDMARVDEVRRLERQVRAAYETCGAEQRDVETRLRTRFTTELFDKHSDILETFFD